MSTNASSFKRTPLTGAQRQQRYRERQQQKGMVRVELQLSEEVIKQLDALCQIVGKERSELVSSWVGQATRQVRKRAKKPEKAEPPKEKVKKERSIVRPKPTKKHE